MILLEICIERLHYFIYELYYHISCCLNDIDTASLSNFESMHSVFVKLFYILFMIIISGDIIPRCILTFSQLTVFTRKSITWRQGLRAFIMYCSFENNEQISDFLLLTKLPTRSL